MGDGGLGFLGRHPLGIFEPKGVESSKSTKKIQFDEHLCYLAFKMIIGLQIGNFFGVSFPDGRFKNQFSKAEFQAAA